MKQSGGEHGQQKRTTQVYVVTTDSKYSLAKSLLRNASDVSCTRNFDMRMLEAELGENEMILAVVDAEFLNNPELTQLLGQLAGQYPEKLVTVVFDNVGRPDFLDSYILYDVKSPRSLEKVRQRVEEEIIGVRPDTQRKLRRRVNDAFWTAIAVGFIAAGACGGVMLTSGVTTLSRILLLITSIMVLLTIILRNWYTKLKREERRSRGRSIEQRNYLERLEDATLFDSANTGAEDSPRSVMGLGYFASQNANTIRGYYERVREMARIAFVLAIVMCVTGVVVAVGSIFLIMENFADNFAMVMVVGVMAIVMAVIVWASLKFYKYTIEQVKFYFKAQHENERLIVSVSLAERMNNERTRDNLISKIVKGELDLNAAEMEAEEKKER